MSTERHRDPASPVFSPDPPQFGFKATFRVPYHTHVGQSLMISGSPVAVGQWDPSRAVPMFWKDGDVCYCVACFLT